MTAGRAHWERVYRSRKPEEQSWFQPRPETSLDLIRSSGCNFSARIIDVGGGTSHLVDELLASGYGDVTVLDISPSALAEVKQRLGDQVQRVHWIEADITSGLVQGPYDLWHDRAVFHFLIDATDRLA